jgi:hypothetical protein
MGTQRILDQLQVFQPQKEKCLEDVTMKYEEIAEFEKTKAKQSRMTRAIL